MRRSVLLAAALAASACSRDLTIPSGDPVTVNPGFAAVAPRELLVLSAAGGAGGYRFGFASGGQLSGPDASIDPTSGWYRAGALGSAQDVVVVTDRSGATATARITVGPRLSVSPSLAVVAPGGALVFVPSGGKLPYTLSLVSPDPVSTLAQAGITGSYVAGTAGNVVDKVVVTDATGDAAAASATAEVHVGPPLVLYRGSTGAVAPGESVNFVGLGGQPPYVYAMASAPSGGTVSTTGTYTAGATGNRTDVVQVSDANGIVATAQVDVGAALVLDPLPGAPRPGEPTQLVARDGKPPYAFAFRAKGNRSRGTLDAITGAYVPGPNFGAVDLVQVTDATGTVATRDLPAVGPLRLNLGLGVNACHAADFNGDGRDDLLFFQDLQFTTYARPRTAAPVQETYFRNVLLSQTIVGDFNEDQHGEVVMMQGGSLAALVPDLAGNLSLARASDGKSYVQEPGQWFTAEMVAPVFGASGGRELIVSEYGSTNTLAFVTWPRSQSGPNAYDVAAGHLGAGGPNGTPQLVALAAGDFYLDGNDDLAWLGASSYPSSSGPLWMAWGSSSSLGASTFTNVSATFPTGYTYAPTRASRYSSFSSVPSTGSADNLALVLRQTSTGRNRLALAKMTGKVTQFSGTPLDPFPGDPAGAAGVTGFVSYSGIVWGDVKIVAWNEADGRIADVRYDGSGNLTVSSRAPIDPLLQPGFPVSCVAAGDVNGDGTKDLALASTASPTAEIYWADGDGGFGRRARFAALVPPRSYEPPIAAVVDVDGDQVADVVAATETPGLAVLFGGGRQLAWGGETPVSQPIGVLAAGNFRGDGAQSAIYQEQSGAFRIAAGASSGAFGVPQTWAVTNANGTAFTTVLGALKTAASAAGTVPALYSPATGTLHTFRMVGTNGGKHFSAGMPANTDSCAFLPAGLGIGRVAALCDSTLNGDLLVYVASLTGTGASEAYGAWSLAGTWTNEGGWKLPVGQLADGSAVFLQAGSAVAAVTVPPAGSPVRTSIGPFASVFVPSFLPSRAALGDVTADGFPDIVTSDGYGTTTLLRRSAASTYARVAGYSVTGSVLAVAPLAPGIAADVLLAAGSEIVPIPNDGTGTLR